MEIIIYILIFIIGTLCGSFFSLATYRIPIGKNITHERSFCPKCDHKLIFWDMIPVLSYLFLKGKCRHCSAKIGYRYILLEVISGTIFLLFALSLNINFLLLDINKIIYLVIGLLYISGLMIIGMIDKENRIISKQVLIYGMIVLFTYILYLYILGTNVYRYGIYLFIMSILVSLNIILLKRKSEENYTINILLLCIYIMLFSQNDIFMYTVFLTILIILIKSLFGDPNKNKNLPVAYYICNINIVFLIIQSFYSNMN